MKTTTEILTGYGWEFYDKCYCGALRHEYRNEAKPELNLFYWPGQRAFAVKQNRGSKTKIGVTRIIELETILKGL